jgi:23S rRNA (cytidine1920-2'-O)/16S rRNA (cytidine1409-2'-O)-methyltransferase
MKRARPSRPESCGYVGKGGLKLEFALRHFGLAVSGWICADLGCHRGGFTDCLLQQGALRVHAVDTGYGILDWKLRGDPRVVVHERTNLLYWKSPEPLDLAVIDAGWTPQRLSVPAALRSLKPACPEESRRGGAVLSLVKPQYEVERSELQRGVLPAERLAPALERVRAALEGIARIEGEVQSPIPGSGGNIEFWLYLDTKSGNGDLTTGAIGAHG